MKGLNNNLSLKKDREKNILLSLVDYYIKANKPVGSHSLQSHGLNHLSSATIRNYFNKLEKKGFLSQAHASGGRIPTDLAFREYANHFTSNGSLSKKDETFLTDSLQKETKEILDYLQEAAHTLSELTQCSCCFTLPLFDQDMINNIKVIPLDQPHKALCILITDFGFVRTEVMYFPKSLSTQDCQDLEDFFLYRVGKREKISFSDKSLSKLANYFYQEILVRHIVGYKNLTTKDIHKTGLAKLLSYPEFKSPALLAGSLSLFEDSQKLQTLLYETMKINRLSTWIGQELNCINYDASTCCMVAIPYYLNNMPVGAIAILGPLRLNYRRIFGILQAVSKNISLTLTKSVYKFQLPFRPTDIQKNPSSSHSSILLEDKSKEHYF